MLSHSFIEALKFIIQVLDSHGILYQISGGFSAHLYGANRPINDIDIDVMEKDLPLLEKLLKPYIQFGLDQYKDEKWDLSLINLSYKGQEIDIGGAQNTFIFDELQQEWVHCPADLATAQDIVYQGLKLKVCDPQDLIAYKSLLNGDHQKADIQAVQEYLKKL